MAHRMLMLICDQLPACAQRPSALSISALRWRRLPVDARQRAVAQVDEHGRVREVPGPDGAGFDGGALRRAEGLAELGVPAVRGEAERPVVVAGGVPESRVEPSQPSRAEPSRPEPGDIPTYPTLLKHYTNACLSACSR